MNNGMGQLNTPLVRCFILAVGDFPTASGFYHGAWERSTAGEGSDLGPLKNGRPGATFRSGRLWSC